LAESHLPFVGAKILLVEPHDFLRRTLHWWLTKKIPQFQIIEATTTEEALPHVQINSLRVIIVYDEFLTMGGVKATLRSAKNGSKPQVVVLDFREDSNGQPYSPVNGANTYIYSKNLHHERQLHLNQNTLCLMQKIVARYTIFGENVLCQPQFLLLKNTKFYARLCESGLKRCFLSVKLLKQLMSKRLLLLAKLLRGS
jgi:hypothetical protein